MPYVAQLLPDLVQARVLRDALAQYVLEDHTDEDKDAAWEMLAKLTNDMRKKGKA
jgi:hypothetical protein